MLAAILWPVSLLFRILVAGRRFLYQTGFLNTTRLPVPVIVVGNVFVGGTGKTPLVIWLVDALRGAGHTPGIVSRGYGVQNDEPLSVTADTSPADAGDEPVLIARRSRVPVMVGRKRADAGKALLAAHPEISVIISDDGLQHYSLERDIEIVLFDTRGAGNGWLLPAGPLREPMTRRRDFTVVNTDRLSSDWPGDTVRMQLTGENAEQLGDRTRRVALSLLPTVAPANRSPRIVAAAGIGNPARFFTMLRSAGLVFDEMPLPDHYVFQENTFEKIAADIILITEKDAVKCKRIDMLKTDPRLWVVPVTAHIDGALAGKIVEKLRGHPTA